MTKMTSSSSAANKQHTDFSIQSIIHGSRPRSTTGELAAAAASNARCAGGPQAAAGEVAVRKYRPKNFQCPACKMAFSNNGQLKNHVRIHTGERPFRCDLDNCRKSFTRNEELTRHKLIHTGFRPHSCSACGKRFGRKDHLKKHLRTHERKKLRRRVSLITSNSTAPPGQQQVVVPVVSAESGHSQRFQQEARFLEQQFTVRSLAHCVSAPPHPPSLSSRLDRDVPSLLSTTAPSTTRSLLSGHQHFHLPCTATPTTAAFPSSYAALLHDHHHQKPLLTLPHLPPTSATAVAAATIQQLATDYWSKWYNLLGLYHGQPPPVVVSAAAAAAASKSPIDQLFISKHI